MPTLADERALVSGPAPVLSSFGVFDAFAQCAEQHSTKLAIAEPSRQIHYGDLAKLVAAFARELRSLGRSPHGPARVALSAEPSIPYIAALLALLQERISYVPLPLDQPSTRRQTMRDLAAPLVTWDAWDLEAVFERFLAHGFSAHGFFAPAASNERDAVPARAPAGGDHEAYVLFTSGSTGVPKGVRGSARALASRLLWMRDYHALGPGDRMLAKASTGFDVSLVELLGPLVSGASVELTGNDARSRPDRLVTVLIERGITAAVLLPSQLEQVLSELGGRPLPLRHVFTGGEAFGIDLVQRFSEALPHATLTNGYGPTEATISVTAWRAVPSAERVELGSPLPGVDLLVVDDEGNPVEQSGRGELWIGGPCLALGYLERGHLEDAGAAASEAFGPATAHAAGARFYRSGDRVERDGDRLTFVGRLDGQVKVGGIRVELGDVEALLRAQPDVTEVAVELDDSGGLVAYFTSAKDRPNEAALLAELAARLAEPLLPRLVKVAGFALDANGKIDRRALQRGLPKVEKRATDDSSPLATARRIWSEVLGHHRFDDDSDYFAAGGTSLGILRLRRAWERTLDRPLELGLLYEATTPRTQAQLLARANPHSAHDPERDETFPFLYLLTHEDPTELPSRLTAALTRLLQSPIVVDEVVDEAERDTFLASVPSVFRRRAQTGATATLHARTRASLLTLALPAAVARAVERPDEPFDPLGLTASLRECAPDVRVAPLRDPALWARRSRGSDEIPAHVLARATDAAWRARTGANQRLVDGGASSIPHVPFHGLERFHSQCLLGAIEGVCRTLFGHGAHDAVLGERTMVVDARGAEVTLTHQALDFSLLRERLRRYHGVEFRRLPAPPGVVSAFIERLECGHPLLVDFDFAHLAHRPEYDAAPSYHPVVLVGADRARDCFLAHEQTSGLVEIPFAECESYFAGTLPNGERPGIIECSVTRGERPLDAEDVAARLTLSLDHLLSTDPARGLGALERALRLGRRTGAPANWSGTWILSHDLFGLERLLRRARRDLDPELWSDSDFGRMGELRQAWHRADAMFEHARLTGERRLTSLGLEQALRLMDQERSLAARMLRARDRLLERAARRGAQ